MTTKWSRFFVAILICVPIALAYGARGSTHSDDIDQLITSAAEDGIPESILLGRVAEGVAKEASEEHIQQALTETINNLSEARDLLLGVDGGQRIVANEASWEWTAIILGAGASPRAIKAIAAASVDTGRTRNYREATTAYLELVQSGVRLRIASELSVGLLRSRLPATQFQDLDRILVHAESQGGSMNGIAQLLVDQLPDLRSVEQLERLVQTYLTEPVGSSDAARDRDDDDDDAEDDGVDDSGDDGADDDGTDDDDSTDDDSTDDDAGDDDSTDDDSTDDGDEVDEEAEEDEGV